MENVQQITTLDELQTKRKASKIMQNFCKKCLMKSVLNWRFKNVLRIQNIINSNVNYNIEQYSHNRFSNDNSLIIFK